MATAAGDKMPAAMAIAVAVQQLCADLRSAAAGRARTDALRSVLALFDIPHAALAAASISQLPVVRSAAVAQIASAVADAPQTNVDAAQIDALEHIDPAEAPIGIVAILIARIQQLPLRSRALARTLVRTRSFVLACELSDFAAVPSALPSLALQIDKWATDTSASVRTNLSIPAAAAAILVPLCTRINAAAQNADGAGKPSATHITPIHAIALKYCILAKNFRAAIPLIENPATNITTPSTGPCSALDFLLYHYYGGIALSGLRRHAASARFFETCLHAPTNTVSLVQIEAYRRMIFASLLSRGASPQLPKTVSVHISRTCRNHAQPFIDFAALYASNNVNRIAQKSAAFVEQFTSNRTLGLARQCIDNIARRHILQLTKTYLSLSLSDISTALDSLGSVDLQMLLSTESAASSAKSPISLSMAMHTAQNQKARIANVERQVLRMIDLGQVLAKISHIDGGMVFFHDSCDKSNTFATAELLEREIQSAFNIDADAARIAKRIGLSREYLQRTMAERPKQQSSMGEDD